MTDKSRAAAKAEEVLQKMQATLSINPNNSMSSSAEVDNILGQMQKEATGQSQPKHMQVIGLEEEVRLKEVTIKGLHSKISKLEKVISLSHEKISHLEVVEAENKELNETVKENEGLQEENQKMKEELSTLKEKNATVMQTAKEHQKGWKKYISKLEAKLSEKEKENELLRSKMSNLIEHLEGTIDEFSQLKSVDTSETLAMESESVDYDAVEAKVAAKCEDRRDDSEVSEVKTTLEKGLAGFAPITEKLSNSACFPRCEASAE